MLEHGILVNGLVEGDAKDRKAWTPPSLECDVVRLRPFGDEGMMYGAFEYRPVKGLDPGIYRNGIGRCRGERGFLIQLTRQRPAVEPAPLACKRRRDDDGDFRGFSLHDPDGRHGPVELKYDLPTRGHILAGRGDAGDMKRRGVFRRIQGHGKKSAELGAEKGETNFYENAGADHDVPPRIGERAGRWTPKAGQPSKSTPSHSQIPFP